MEIGSSAGSVAPGLGELTEKGGALDMADGAGVAGGEAGVEGSIDVPGDGDGDGDGATVGDAGCGTGAAAAARRQSSWPDESRAAGATTTGLAPSARESSTTAHPVLVMTTRRPSTVPVWLGRLIRTETAVLPSGSKGAERFAASAATPSTRLGAAADPLTVMVEEFVALVGLGVGIALGLAEGVELAVTDGVTLAFDVGVKLAFDDGVELAFDVGVKLAFDDGVELAFDVGATLTFTDGDELGLAVGVTLAFTDGDELGLAVGVTSFMTGAKVDPWSSNALPAQRSTRETRDPEAGPPPCRLRDGSTTRRLARAAPAACATACLAPSSMAAARALSPAQAPSHMLSA